MMYKTRLINQLTLKTKKMIKKDKAIEQERYDSRAINHIKSNSSNQKKTILDIPLIHRKPYIVYEDYLKSILDKNIKVLEIGSGTGEHTYSIIKSGADITASDISPNSLNILQKRYKNYKNFQTKVADMESLPFDSNSFDLVCSAGSLSYGNHTMVRNEIERVLKPYGYFVCVDSLNHNPIYIANRFINYLKKDRSISTIKRIPSLNLILSYEKIFKVEKISFHGSLIWLSPLISFIFGDKSASNLLDWFDRKIKVKKSAFKFVFLLRKR